MLVVEIKKKKKVDTMEVILFVRLEGMEKKNPIFEIITMNDERPKMVKQMRILKQIRVERERRIFQLKSEIAKLEAITNRTSEQEFDLQNKKIELENLEREKQEQNSKKTNWTLWIVGGIALVIVIGVVIYLLTRNKNKEVHGK